MKLSRNTKFSRAIGWTRPVVYAFGNLIEPSYVAAAIEAQLLARAPEARVRVSVRRKLYRYLKYCHQYSAYWKERWPAGSRDFAEEEAEDILASLPLLTKDDLRRYGDQLHIKPEQRVRRDGYPGIPGQMMNHSGGSTGVPSEVWQDRHFASHNRAVIDCAYASVGVVPGRMLFYLWGSNNELSDTRASYRKRLSTWARGLIPMPAFSLDEQKVLAYVDLVNSRHDVDSALCFVSAVDTFLAFVEKKGCALRRISRVVTGGGKLHADLRMRIRRVWADDVYEIYGARDAGLMGAEAPDHDGIQIFPWHNYVEVLKGGKRVSDGASGEIHVTCLQNYSCALLRFNMGDVARYRGTRQGWNRSRIADILGRTAEHLTTADGGRIDPSAVIHLIGVIESRPWMRKFQLVQNGPLDLTLRLETWSRPGREILDEYGGRIGAALGRMLGGQVSVRIELLDQIPPAASGKYLYSIGWRGPNG
jgi:phenylacetate-CoA ligase